MSRDALLLMLFLLLSLGGALWRLPEVGEQGMTASSALRIMDASGVPIASGDYQRLVCASTIAASVVPELISPDRVVMVADHFMLQSPRAFLLEHAERLSSLDSVEAIMAVKPDLVLLNSLGHKPESLDRLREKGLVVMDLGKIRGWSTLKKNILDLGLVLKQEKRARDLVRGLDRRLHGVAQGLHPEERPGALWIAVYGGQIYGGTEGSSYHDLLTFSGLRDMGQGAFEYPWPSISLEKLLSMDPEVIVTRAGGGGEIRALPGVERLQAVEKGRVIELPPGADTTSPRLLEACEFLFDAVHGKGED